LTGKAVTKVDNELAKLNMTFDRGLDLDNRIIYIFDDIDETMAENVVMSLQHLSLSDGGITIMINSQGGSVNDMFAIYDAMQACPNEIVTVGIGEICSAAGLLLVGGDKRLAAPHAVFMAHNVHGGIDEEGELHTVHAQMKATLMVWKMWAKCMAKHTKHTENFWFKEMSNTVRELWLDADQMKQKKHGIIDGIWE
jgi:ATP-dependent Clp endopeptidase proteolytic subunit ClpP